MKAPLPSPEAARRAALTARLLAAARARPHDERVPAGFAQRVNRQLTAPLPPDAWQIWVRGFRQALIPAMACLAVVAWLQPRAPHSPTHDADTEAEAAEISLWDALDASTGELEL